eukprot:scaffold158120_cov41-Tisochrysis_lutea.AAC.4
MSMHKDRSSSAYACSTHGCSRLPCLAACVQAEPIPLDSHRTTFFALSLAHSSADSIGTPVPNMPTTATACEALFRRDHNARVLIQQPSRPRP